MFQKLKSKKVVIGGLVFLSIVSLIYLFTATKKTPPPTPLPSSPQPSPQVPLEIVDSYPPPGDYALNFPITALVFTFNQPISLNNLRLDIVPKTELVLSISPDKYSLHARPANPWKYGAYKITLTATGGVVLIEKTVNFVDPAKIPDENSYGDPIGPNYHP